MAVITEAHPGSPSATGTGVPGGILAAQNILRAGFTVLPIIAGTDKYLHFLADWDRFLNPALVGVFPGGAHGFMNIVGVIEIAGGLLVGFASAIGGIVVGVWLLGITVNLLTIPGFYDIALRDFGLALGAFSLSALSSGVSERRRAGRKEEVLRNT